MTVTDIHGVEIPLGILGTEADAAVADVGVPEGVDRPRRTNYEQARW